MRKEKPTAEISLHCVCKKFWLTINKRIWNWRPCGRGNWVQLACGRLVATLVATFDTTGSSAQMYACPRYTKMCHDVCQNK